MVDIDGVGSEVPAGGFGGVGRQVGREHGAGASGGGVHREAAVAADDVEDVTCLGQIAERPPVGSLVEEVAGLLALDRVSGHRVAVLEEGDASVGGLAENDVAVGSPGSRRDRTGQPEDHPLGFEMLGQRIEDVIEVHKPCGRVELHDERRSVAVHDETRDMIVFAVQPAQPGDLVIVHELSTTLNRLLDAGSPQLGAHRGLVGCKDSDPDGRGRIPESDRGEVTFVVEDDGEIARLAVVGDSLDGLVEDPRMSTADVAQCRGAIRTARLRRPARSDSVGTLRGYDGSVTQAATRMPVALVPDSSICITLHNEDFRRYLAFRQGLDRAP